MSSDFGTPVAQVDPNQGLQTISSLLSLRRQQLGIQQQQQSIQGQQSVNQSLAAGAQEDQQKMQERQSVQKMLKTGVDDQGNSIRNEAGEPDASKLLPALGRVAPLTGQAIAQSVLKTQSDKVGLEAASTSLDAGQRELLSGIAGSNIGNPNADSKSFGADVDNLVAQHPGMANAANYAKSLAAHIDNVPDPKGKDHMWQRLQALMQNPGQLSAQQQPSTQITQGPSGLQPVQTNQRAPGGIGVNGPTLPQGIAPAVVTTPTGQLGRIGPSGSSVTPLSGPPGSAPTPAASAGQLPAIPRPAANAPAYQQQQYQAQNKANMEHVQAVAQAYSDPQNNPQATRYRNAEILRLTETANTGPGKDVWNHFASQFPGESGDAYQKIGHYLAQNTIAGLNTMGVPNTNAGEGTAAAATGNVTQNPGAIKEITKVNDAVNTARDKYTKGLQKVTQNQSNFDQVPAYRQAFGQNFDINLFRLEDAQRRGDHAEVNAITQKLGPAGLKALGQKKRIIDSLTNNGTLPQ